MVWWICTRKDDGDEEFVFAADLAELDALDYRSRRWVRLNSRVDTLPEYPKREGDTIVNDPPTEQTKRDITAGKNPGLVGYIERENARQDVKHDNLKGRVRALADMVLYQAVTSAGFELQT